MIFVNELWSLKDIPLWLEHVESGVDGIGLADVVFPGFLFIVGLSIPYAMDARKRRGDSNLQITKHIVLRTIALLVMGVFLVNGETYNAHATGMARVWWNPICCLCFILIWNRYPSSMNKYLSATLKIVGIVTLLFLAIIYRGGDDNKVQYFSPQWWGILGLIGWAYLASSLVTLFANNKFSIVLGGWIFFCVLSVCSHAGLIPGIFSFIPDAILGGTLTGLSMGGVLTTFIFNYYRGKRDDTKLTFVLLGFSAFLIILSLVTRPYWGLAKLGATPAWLFLCSAFTILAFIAIYWVADVLGKANWFSIVRPAGTDTLLCYLIPYFAYAATNITGIHPPEAILIGALGLLKAALFAFLCVLITAGLGKIGLRLKL